ncbi:MAG TPA: ribonuclease D, partial [Gammaproteobacteria bacterium]|nr:ribonuclease D [Gammaproteobacteria bacterium]
MNVPGVTLQVDTPEALAELCRRLDGCDWLALDTEFHREKTYYPQFCLLQLATPELVAWVDPLTVPDLGPLLELLNGEQIVKVFHAARQDLEIFYHLTGRVPAPVFDTQVAAPLLGHPDQAGYGALVSAVLGVNLSKGHARADWTRRPLPAKQLEYALDDVRYLARLYPQLRDELQQRGRLQWLAEDFAALVDPAQYENPPASAWRRIRGTDRLRAAQL